MLVLVNRNKFKIDRQQHKSTSNFVSANSLIAKFIRYASSIASLCVNASDRSGTFMTCRCCRSQVQIKENFEAAA